MLVVCVDDDDDDEDVDAVIVVVVPCRLYARHVVALDHFVGRVCAEKTVAMKGKRGAHRSFHSVVVMVRPPVSVVMAECFCCSSCEIKELPGMCASVYMCLCECEKGRGVHEISRNDPSCGAEVALSD